MPAGDSIPTPPSIPSPIPIPVSERPPAALELPGADSPPHVAIASFPKQSKLVEPHDSCTAAAYQQRSTAATEVRRNTVGAATPGHEGPVDVRLSAEDVMQSELYGEAPCGAARGGRLLPGRRRILRAAAKQLAAVELLQEQLDVSAVDIDTHGLPPPDAADGSSTVQQQQQHQLQHQEEQTFDTSPLASEGRHLEFLRLHALLQAAVGAEQDVVVVGLHQVATQHRLAWAGCVAAAFAAAEGAAARAMQRHLWGPESSCVAGGSAAAAAAAGMSRRSSSTRYEQIVPLDASPHYNQLLLVYVHPSHLSNITLLSIAKTRLGSFCCRSLQQNYCRPWGLSPGTQKRLQQQREQWKQQLQQQQQQQQQRMDFFFNFTHFLGLSESAADTQAAAGAPAAETAAAEAAATAAETERPQSPPIHLRGLSRRLWHRQQRLQCQRQQDGICCSRRCAALARGSSSARPSRSSSSSSSSCGCEVFQEAFAYGGVAARVLIGATPVVFACADVKLNEEALETCSSRCCCNCGPQQPEHPGSAHAAAAAAAAAGRTTMDYTEREATAAQEHRKEEAWRKALTKAVQRQQLLTILADLRFETDSGWASALELKPLLLLGAQQQLGALQDRQRRLQQLQQLDITTKASAGFFCCRVPQRPAGPQLLSLQETGRMAQWRRPAWTWGALREARRGAPRGAPRGSPAGDPQGLPHGVCGGSIARFWVRWMSCRLVVERVDAERVKTTCNELRQTLKQEGRSLSKLIIDPPLLQLPPIRPFEPMELKISLSNPHVTLPTAYSVYCLSDSGKAIVPLSHVSYWHGALSRKWQGGPFWEAQSFQSLSSCEAATRPSEPLQLSLQREQQQLLQREQPQLLQLEKERIQEQTGEKSHSPDPLAPPASTSSDDTQRGGDVPAAAPGATAAAADAPGEVQQPIRLERWLLVDWPQGFLRGGETRVLSLVLNIQEGIYKAQELACGVLVLRLEDSRQDFFFCLAASLIPSLLGAELQPLALLGDKPLLPPTSPEVAGSAQTPALSADTAEPAAAEPPQRKQSEEKGGPDVQQEALESNEETRGDAEGKHPMLPMPKELWWLLSHLHSHTQAAAAAAAADDDAIAADSLRRQTNRSTPKRQDNSRGDDRQSALGQALATDSSSSNSNTSDSSSDSEDGDLSGGASCCSTFCEQQQQQRGLRGPKSGEGLMKEVVRFLSAAGGDSFTWPSFFAGSDTFMQPQRVCFEAPAAAAAAPPAAPEDGDRGPSSSRSVDDNTGSSSNSSSSHTSRRPHSRRSLLSRKDEHCRACCRGPLQREVVFLRACIEQGVEIPPGVSVGAALALLEYWGRTCCFFPSEFAVQDVQTDGFHILCRAVLLSLPPVHRNAFIAIISALNELLHAATRSQGPARRAGGTNVHPAGPCSGDPCCTGGAHSAHGCGATLAGAEAWDSCCLDKVQGTEAEGEEGALKVGEKGGGPPRRPPRGPPWHAGCLESAGAAELLRHALLLWAGVWLLKSCRPAVRHAVLGHFIARV
ncbi:uncharacterized protein EMH_0032790 [Eimeria mitis]|uniref:Uncharacterized protein n=1 Tax=Eimeria mitis TaxID=44415 RepID=U6K3K9_9EIME|nr:uncharacterized protein EMH_0032790 [Eimeria mitis]CDJ30897.1 hypothetical protein, conserved [Eimeria mitis]